MGTIGFLMGATVSLGIMLGAAAVAPVGLQTFIDMNPREVKNINSLFAVEFTHATPQSILLNALGSYAKQNKLTKAK